ncbi:MAG: molybdopterin-dependent oxidoreductase, partial [Proteobacteria bacterium]|nr:molybdopterin-dependent oxidoreductase [Pseudomonadota bacterium]
MSKIISRRGFVLAGGGVAAAFISGCSLIPPIPKRPMPETEDALGWMQLTSGGQWRLWSPRMEMGQGIMTSLRLLAAEELGVPPARIDVRLPSTDKINRVKATVGSDSIREFALPLARACATLRDAVLARAAARLAPASDLRFEDGRVVNSVGESVTLSEIAVPTLELEVEERPVEKLRAFSAKSHRYIGRGGPTAQIEAIVAGGPAYAADIRLPDMVYARVLQPPWIPELEPSLDSLDEAAVREVPGFVDIVRHDALAGPALVAANPAALDAMREAAKPVWTGPEGIVDPMVTVDIDAALGTNDFTKSDGRVDPGPWTVDMRLDLPLAAHGAIEPRCAVARFNEDGSLQLWCSTQDPFFTRDLLARDHDLPLEKIVVQAMRVGGGYGGKVVATVEREAAFIARAAGRPVKLQWTREDEFQASYLRPPYSHRVKARVGADGRISDWWHATSSSHVFFTNAGIPAWMQKITNLFGDAGTARGLLPPYGFARQRTDYKLTRLPVYTGPWRGLGAGPNVLAIEMAMDAAARASGQEPLEFRLRHLDGAGDPEVGDRGRYAMCLRRAAEMAKKEPVAELGAGGAAARGLAGGIYKGMSYAAAVAEVVLQRNSDGRIEDIRVRKIWCAHDCGLVIDPDGVRAQIEGNLVWSLGMTLKE